MCEALSGNKKLSGQKKKVEAEHEVERAYTVLVVSRWDEEAVP